MRDTCYSDTTKSTPKKNKKHSDSLHFGLRVLYEASSIGPSSSPSARLARISISVRAKRPQSSLWATESCKDHRYAVLYASAFPLSSLTHHLESNSFNKYLIFFQRSITYNINTTSIPRRLEC